MRPCVKRFEFWCSVAVIVFFFFPWVAFGPISVAGYQVGDILRQGPQGRSQDAVWMILLLYLIPASSLLAIAIDLGTSSKTARGTAHFVAGALPFVALLVAYSDTGGNLFKALSIGAYFTLLAAAGSLAGPFIITRSDSECVRRRVTPSWGAPHSITAIAGAAAFLSGLWTALDDIEFVRWLIERSRTSYPHLTPLELFFKLPRLHLVLFSWGAVAGVLALLGGIMLLARKRSGILFCAVFAGIGVISSFIGTITFGLPRSIRIPFVKTIPLNGAAGLAIYMFLPITVAVLVGILWYRYGLPPQQQWEPVASGKADDASVETRLGQLKGLLAKGLISPEDFETKKQELLSRLVSGA